MKAVDFAKRKAMYKLIDYYMADPDHNLEKILNGLDALVPQSMFTNQRKAFRYMLETENNWYQLIKKLGKLNPNMITDMMKTFVVDANFLAWDKQEKSREKYQCNVPWAILLDPTSACNLHCTGCWAADYGHALNLSLEDIDSIVTQGKALGTYIYIYTGGEPLVRKKDLIRICEMHPDCIFLAFTNSTLIDQEFCDEMIRVKNFLPAISAEGDEAATDGRRGDGTYQKISVAMDLLRKNGLPFGVSACYTSANAYSIASEEYYDWLIDKGALFLWIFTYMPVGVDSPKELMPTPEQRVHLYNFNRAMRDVKPIFTLDFQNDGEFVGGCIAGGRRYMHINAAGDVEPCVFIHYSNVNIHDVSLLDALRSPLFMQYYENQPFNDNLLRPCPMLENPDVLPQLVEQAGAHSTDLQQSESPEELTAKTREFAEQWKPVAEQIWTDPEDPRALWRDRTYIGMSDSDINKFRRLGREMHGAFDMIDAQDLITMVDLFEDEDLMTNAPITEEVEVKEEVLVR